MGSQEAIGPMDGAAFYMGEMGMEEYLEIELITYNCGDRFDIERFRPARNSTSNKPAGGGFWGSPVESTHGWKDWCKAEDFCECREEDSFKTLFAGNALIIHGPEWWHNFDWRVEPNACGSFHKIDFEGLLEDGIDGIYLTERGEITTRFKGLYGWDVESVYVLNPECITNLETAIQKGTDQ